MSARLRVSSTGQRQKASHRIGPDTPRWDTALSTPWSMTIPGWRTQRSTMMKRPSPQQGCCAGRLHGSQTAMFTSRESSVITGRVTDQHCGSKRVLSWASLRNGHDPTDRRRTARSNAFTERSQMGGLMPGATNQKTNATTHLANGSTTIITTDPIPHAEASHQSHD